ncbi:MAG: carboxylesterase family protein, partial [Steroidobacteraceae bacterium]
MTSSNQACSWTFAVVMMSLCAALTAADAGAATAPADGALTVQIADGTVRGRAGQGVREFNGIPFAAPPVGDLRFAPPAPALPWQGVLDATQLRDACPQARRFNLTEASDVEDCLHLNVAVPTAPHSGTRPVLVWFYGGAFVGGSTRLYPNDFLARAGDMVVVSVNYRLGPLGWMAHPAFGAQANGGYALEDQRAALRWVQRNIAQFGGDPARVTSGGVSAGAASVCMHLISPEATTGLFHQAIIQSSGCTFTLRSLEEGKNAGLAV